MTNAFFPDFALANALKTTCTQLVLKTTINDLQANAPEIYTHDKTLCIKLLYDAQLSVFDINGKMLISKPINSGLNYFPIQISGAYLVRITGNEGSFARKVIIE